MISVIFDLSSILPLNFRVTYVYSTAYVLAEKESSIAKTRLGDVVQTLKLHSL